MKDASSWVLIGHDILISHDRPAQKRHGLILFDGLAEWSQGLAYYDRHHVLLYH